MNLLGLHHGDTRNRNIKVGDGSVYTRREIYCAFHGFIDAFIVGGNDGFRAKHAHCNRRPKNGAEFEEVKAFSKAA